MEGEKKKEQTEKERRGTLEGYLRSGGKKGGRKGSSQKRLR